MTSSAGSFEALDNPFSIHRVRPGSIPYLFSPVDDATDVAQLDQLIDCWRANCYVGQIVGPHGCGKTTLAYSVARRALDSGQCDLESALSITIRKRSSTPQDSRPPKHDWSTHFGSSRFVFTTKPISHKAAIDLPELEARPSSKTILIIDGIEQLNTIERMTMTRALRRRQIPTVITVHRVLRQLPFVAKKWPVLFQVNSDLKLFTKLVDSLTGASSSIDVQEIEAGFRSFNGNCRDAFMHLYDIAARENHA